MKPGGEAPGEFTLAYLAVAVAGILILAGERRAAKRIRRAEERAERIRDRQGQRVEAVLEHLAEVERERDELHFELDGDVLDAGKTALEEDPGKSFIALEPETIDPESRAPKQEG
ncbi:MAG TPA: hypothetical protein VFI17_03465 [Solirubrobacterales bacterium]|nr:hypothetical protein [Solirubrobacterales bacterium]